MKLKLLFTILLTSSLSFSQNVGINSDGTAPDNSAMLDIVATDKGVLIPRIALTATNVTAPVTNPDTSLLVYNYATAGTSPNNVYPGFYYWDSIQWVRVATGEADKDWFEVGQTRGADNIGDNIFTNGKVGVNKNPDATMDVQFNSNSTNNPINNGLAVANAGSGDAIALVRTSGSTAGDPFLSFDIANETGYAIGIDNSDGNKLKIANNWSNVNINTRMTIQQNGNVGLGTTAPTQTLDVSGNARLRNQLYDENNLSGTAGQVLSSTATGTEWVNVAAVTPAVIGVLSNTSASIAVDGNTVYTGSYIDLPPGKWIVQVSMLLRKESSPFVLNDDEGYWVRSSLSDSPTVYAESPDFEGASLFSGSFVGPCEFGLINGTCIINNSGATTKRYYYWKANSNVYGSNGVAGQALSNFGTSLYGENQIVATPVN